MRLNDLNEAYRTLKTGFFLFISGFFSLVMVGALGMEELKDYRLLFLAITSIFGLVLMVKSYRSLSHMQEILRTRPEQVIVDSQVDG